MRRLFISCPMKGRTEGNIRRSMDRLHKMAEIIFDQKLEVIDSYIEDNPPQNVQNRVWYLGKSIQLMAQADYFIGVRCSEMVFPGCYVESMAARLYGIQMTMVNSKEFMPDVREIEQRYWNDCEKCCVTEGHNGTAQT